MSDPTRVLDVRIQLRNDSAAQWTAVNPTPMKGEIGVEIDTGLFKFGDGITPWNNLPYGANPAIQLAAPPQNTDWQYLVGTLAIVGGTRPYILVSTGPNVAVWKEVVTMEAIAQLGYGDMLKSVFATINPTDGYVDKALVANQLAQPRNISVNGDVVAAAVEFNGTQNVYLNAALVDIAALAGGGTFIKVQVDSKGRVVGYEALLAEDIPDLTLAKITDAGTAAGKNTGTAIGQVVIVGPDGHIDPSVMPSLTITDVFVVANQAEKLALDADQGDVAILTDTNETFILRQCPADELANWVRIENPLNGIQVINGKSGPTVTLNTDDIEEGNDNLYFTDQRVIDVMETQASTILTDGATILHETDLFILNGGNAAGHNGS